MTIISLSVKILRPNMQCIDNAVFGINSLSKANSIATTFVFGNNNLQNIRKSRINTILGHNNFKNASNIVDRIVASYQISLKIL
jgi:hypothetical protein